MRIFFVKHFVGKLHNSSSGYHHPVRLASCLGDRSDWHLTAGCLQSPPSMSVQHVMCNVTSCWLPHYKIISARPSEPLLPHSSVHWLLVCNAACWERPGCLKGGWPGGRPAPPPPQYQFWMSGLSFRNNIEILLRNTKFPNLKALSSRGCS